MAIQKPSFALKGPGKKSARYGANPVGEDNNTEMKTVDKILWAAATAVVLLAIVTAACLEANRRAEKAAHRT